MDKSKARDFVMTHIKPLADFLNVNDWSIDVEFAPSRDGDGHPAMSIGRKVDYSLANLTVNPEAFDDDVAMLDCLFHELCHLVIAPFDLFYEAASRSYGKHEATGEILERVFTHAMEKTIKTLEWSWTTQGWRDLYLERFTGPGSAS